MVQPSIRIMKKEDIEFVLKLMEIAGWGNTIEDIERNLSYEPDGCFIASLNGLQVGAVNSFLYNHLGFIGDLVVLPEVRNRGIGEALMHHAIQRLQESGAKSIYLDAVPKAISLYTRIGFKQEYLSLRFIGTAKSSSLERSLKMEIQDLDEVSRLDSFFFGVERADKLRRILQDFPNLCFKAEQKGEIIGYIMAKVAIGMIRVGPWICDIKYPKIAEYLLQGLMNHVIGQKLWVGVPEPNTIAVDILEKNGFAPVTHSIRMCYGLCRTIGSNKGIFGIGAPDKG